MQNFQCADNNESQRHGKVGKAFQDELPVATLLMPMYGDGLWFEHGSSTITNERVLSYRASQLHRNLLKLSNEYKLVMELSTPERSIGLEGKRNGMLIRGWRGSIWNDISRMRSEWMRRWRW